MFSSHGHLNFKGTAVAAALCLVSGVQASTLLYGLDFNQLGSNQNFINLGSGSTAISRTTGYINWSNAITPLPDGGYSHCPNGGTFNITSTNGIDGLNFSTGFSVGIHMYYSSSNPDWKDAFSMTIAGTTIRVEMTSANRWVIYNGASIGIADGTELFSANDNEWNYLGLTFKGNEMQVYHDGELVKTVTTNLSDISKVTSIKGSGDHNTAANGLFIDNLAVYDGVLSGSDFAYLNAHEMPLTIPEPATATLGLMGLTALLARRRRA
ncbi:MAG: PEP-CTERM sorting domain-containing protein [Akkermansia sp.]|uniref:LamG-like jellyroll fold domain-containing protein n=1 Tax=Akkermansia sp. TaxID=1872421 RepID=UPI0025BA10E4|nr:LamG-like jellyroll fold domain-containing protein [Akkermansia sp.]MBS5507642.1 PEP-CTERM sorting domain-containing protein [Akkermansia sp.]